MTVRPVNRTAAFWFAFIVVLSPAALAETVWCGNGDGNSLAFVGSWEGEHFRGVFRRFDVEMTFSAQRPETAGLRVDVDVTSAFSDNAMRDEALADPEWFHYADFPSARFTGERAQAGPEAAFRIDGNLQLKGRRHPVSLAFDWREQGGKARMSGSTVLDRTWFGVGEGEWQDESVIAHEVRLEFDVTLAPCGGDR